MKTATPISSKLFSLSLCTLVLALRQQAIAQDAWQALSSVGAPSARILAPNTAIWTGNEMLIWGSSTGAGQATILGDGAAYNPSTDTWRATAATDAPSARVAFTTVWTGSEMIVWGGASVPGVNFNTGARYNPVIDTWTRISTIGAPSARQSHAAVWTGSEMIVWGGNNTYGNVVFGDGARYNPVTDTWTPMSSAGAPSARGLTSPVWTGAEMIIWGGWNSANLTFQGDGARYNPVTDTWTPVQSSGAPTARSSFTAIWTGTVMVIADGQPRTTSGACYNPALNTWTPISASGAPAARVYDSAIWTGTEMIIWGGNTGGVVGVNDGARYNPASDTWTQMTLTGAPSPRLVHGAVWTGSQMIIWGGSSYTYLGAADGYLNDTYSYTIAAGPSDSTPPTARAGLPVIASFTPLFGPTGAAVTITGANFGATPAENIVYFGAIRATVTAASPANLTVLVPVGATYAPITVTVAGLTAYSDKPFLLTFPGCDMLSADSFAARQDFMVGTQPYTFGFGDIDGDGKVDMAVALHNSSTIAFFRNISTVGAIAFSPAGSVNVGGSGNTILYPICADLDGDGRQDLIAANWGTAKIVVFRNASSIGTFSFEARTDLAVGPNPYSVAVGDFDHDGRPDIASANSGNATVSVIRNVSATGALNAASFDSRQDFATGLDPVYVAVGDIDGDGFLDLITANRAANTLSLIRNNASVNGISFSTRADFSTVESPYEVAVGDLDGDTKLDIVISGNGSTLANCGLFAHRNQATPGVITSGSLAAKIGILTGLRGAFVDLADMNGDGKPDMIATVYEPRTIVVLQNTASAGDLVAGSFAAPVQLDLDLAYSYDVKAADLDGDGRPDLLATRDQNTGYATVYRNICNSTPPDPALPAAIVEISIPPNSQSPYSRPAYDNVWLVSAPPCPLAVNTGIGIIVNPTVVGGNNNHDFALHHDSIQPSPPYIAPHVPNPDSATVTYRFDQAARVSGVEIVQHVNGITQVEGFLGNSLAAMASLGAVFGSSGDVTVGFVANEAQSQTFSFNNSGSPGTLFQLVVRKTAHPFAFANYRIFPLDQNGNRIPIATDCGQSTPPTINCPADITLTCAPATGLAVTVFAGVTDSDSGQTLTVSLKEGTSVLDIKTVSSPADNTLVTFSAVTMLPGPHALTIDVSDGTASASCPTTVTIQQDTTAPAAPVLANVTGQCFATVTAPLATDECVGTVTGTTTDPLVYNSQGTFTVHWTFSDGHGNSSTANQTVIVQDTIAPVIIDCPPNIIVQTGPGRTTCDQVATWTAPTASDNCTVASFTSTHNPGTTFPVGTTTVTYTARDGANPPNTTTCTFTVTVQDNTPPTITCPADQTVNATSPAGPVGTFAPPTASDNCSVASIICSPASGSTFAIGTTTVTCIATDGSGNMTSCNFTVKVKSATEQLSDLLALVQSLPIDAGLKNALSAKLQSAACGPLQAFINEVNAQTGKNLQTSVKRLFRWQNNRRLNSWKVGAGIQGAR